MAKSTIEYRILGPLEIWRDGQLVSAGTPKQRALLGMLLLNANRVVSTHELLDELWGPDPPPTARASLQNNVSALRRTLGPDAVETFDGGYRVVVSDHSLDLLRFESLIAKARSLGPEARADALRAALDIWRGLPLVDFPATSAAQATIARLEELRLDALGDRAEANLAAGRHGELVPELEALVLLHPYRERFWELLMLALYRDGRQSDALATYRRVHRRFSSELGLEPSDRLKDLQRRILVGDPAPELMRKVDDVFLRASLLLPSDRPARVRMLVDYAQALRWLGEHERSAVVLAEAHRLASEEGDETSRQRIALATSLVGTQKDATSLGSVLAEARQGAAIFERAGDHAARSAALRTAGQMLRDLGRCLEATDTFRESIDAALMAGDRWQEGTSRNFLATGLLYGPTPVEDAISICEAELVALEWRPPGPVGLWGSLGWLQAMNGDVVAGRRLAAKAVDATRSASMPGLYTWAMGVIAGIDELAGDIPGAIEAHRAILDVLDSLGAQGARAFTAPELARLIAREAPDEAESHVLKALPTADDDVTAQIAWRRALARLRPLEEGRALARDAVELAESTDLLDLRGHALEDLAEHESSARRRRETLHRAAAAFDEKGNRLALHRVHRALGG